MHQVRRLMTRSPLPPGEDTFTSWFIRQMTKNASTMRELKTFAGTEARSLVQAAIPALPVPAVEGALESQLLKPMTSAISWFMEMVLVTLAFYNEIGPAEQQIRAEFIDRNITQDAALNAKLRHMLKLLAALDVIGNWDYKLFLAEFFPATLSPVEVMQANAVNAAEPEALGNQNTWVRLFGTDGRRSVLLRYDMPGNIHFGFIAWHIGLPLERALKWGAVSEAGGVDPGYDANAIQLGDLMGEMFGETPQLTDADLYHIFVENMDLPAIRQCLSAFGMVPALLGNI